MPNGEQTVLRRPAKGGTWEHAWQLVRPRLLSLLLLGALGGFGGRLLSTGLRGRVKDIEPDIDVDVMDPTLLRQLLARIREGQPADKTAQVKEAQLSWKDITALTLALGGGVGGGYLLGKGLGERFGGIDIERDLQQAREEFRKALIEEQLAAAQTSGRSPFAPYLGKASSLKKAQGDEQGFDVGRFLGGMATLLTLPAGVVSYLVLRNYMQKSDPVYARYRAALKELKRRLAAEQPYAQLVKTIPPGLLETMEQS